MWGVGSWGTMFWGVAGPTVPLASPLGWMVLVICLQSAFLALRGDVRQAKLYYLRELSGKAARIKEKLAN